MRVVLNEEIRSGDGTGDAAIEVNAVHIYLDDVLVSGLGALRGEVVIGHAEAALTCGCADRWVGTCVGDCSGNHVVSVDEAITCANIGLDTFPMERCPALDATPDHRGSIDEIVRAVYNLLYGSLALAIGRDAAAPSGTTRGLGQRRPEPLVQTSASAMRSGRCDTARLG